jgi:hypothetical protein
MVGFDFFFLRNLYFMAAFTVYRFIGKKRRQKEAFIPPDKMQRKRKPVLDL